MIIKCSICGNEFDYDGESSICELCHMEEEDGRD